jgi:hypothetical protein
MGFIQLVAPQSDSPEPVETVSAACKHGCMPEYRPSSPRQNAGGCAALLSPEPASQAPGAQDWQTVRLTTHSLTPW